MMRALPVMRPESANATPHKRAVCRPQKVCAAAGATLPGSGVETPDPRLKGVSCLSTENHTCNQSVCLCAQVWSNRSDGSLGKEANLRWPKWSRYPVLRSQRLSPPHRVSRWADTEQNNLSFSQESVSVMGVSSLILVSSWCLVRTGRLV